MTHVPHHLWKIVFAVVTPVSFLVSGFCIGGLAEVGRLFGVGGGHDLGLAHLFVGTILGVILGIVFVIFALLTQEEPFFKRAAIAVIAAGLVTVLTTYIGVSYFNWW